MLYLPAVPLAVCFLGCRFYLSRQLDLKIGPFAIFPIHFAVRYGNLEAYKALEEMGADIFFVHKGQQLIHLAYRCSCNQALINYMSEAAKRQLAPSIRFFHEILKEEYKEATKLQKKLLIVFGDFHYMDRIYMFMEGAFKVGEETGMTTLYIEQTKGNPWTPKKWNRLLHYHYFNIPESFEIKCIDNRVGDIEFRNDFMAREINQDCQHGFVVVGSFHLLGMLSDKTKIDPQKFHIVPFNLSSLMKENFTAPTIPIVSPILTLIRGQPNYQSFVNDPRMVIQCQGNNFSDRKQILLQWNMRKYEDRSASITDPTIKTSTVICKHYPSKQRCFF